MRTQNASTTGTCNGTADGAYYALPATFTVAVPAGATVDRAYLFWGGSITVAANADTTVTAVFNGASSNITGTTQTGTSTLGTVYYKGTADVTAQVAAAAPAGGNITVAGNNFTLNASPAKASCGAAGSATLIVVYNTDINDPAVEPRVVAIDDVTTVLSNNTVTGSVTGLAGASSTPNGRMSATLMEGDVAITPNEAFSFAGNNYDALVNWDEGDKNRDASGEGNSWEIDTIPVTIVAGATSANYSMQTGGDTILPVVLAVSWNVRSDFGDAPASYGIARHPPADLGDAVTRLGLGVDFEGASLFSNDANGDDADGTDDESGVTALPLLTVAATSYTVTTACAGGSLNSVNQTGQISGWIDFNRNGVFDTPSERARRPRPAPPSPGPLCRPGSWPGRRSCACAPASAPCGSPIPPATPAPARSRTSSWISCRPWR